MVRNLPASPSANPADTSAIIKSGDSTYLAIVGSRSAGRNTRATGRGRQRSGQAPGSVRHAGAGDPPPGRQFLTMLPRAAELCRLQIEQGADENRRSCKGPCPDPLILEK